MKRIVLQYPRSGITPNGIGTTYHLPSNSSTERALRFHVQQHPFIPLGAVHDGDTIAHVLYRESVHWIEEDASSEDSDEIQAYREELYGKWEPKVNACRRQPDGTWRIIAERWLFSYANLAVSGNDGAGDDAPGSTD